MLRFGSIYATLLLSHNLHAYMPMLLILYQCLQTVTYRIVTGSAYALIQPHFVCKTAINIWYG